MYFNENVRNHSWRKVLDLYILPLQGTELTDFKWHVFIPNSISNRNLTDEFVRPPFTQVVNNLKKWKSNEELGDLLNKNKENYFGQFQQAHVSVDKARFCVLNHGDYHAKNLMYRNTGLDQEDFLMVIYCL